MDESPPVPLVTVGPLPTNGPKVSVLVTSHNNADYIAQALQSVKHQTYRNLEIVVVDNGSIDDSWYAIVRIAEDDERFTIHRNESIMGYFDVYRQCFTLASGKYATVLNADDRLISGEAISQLVAALESDPEITLATSRCQLIDESGALLGDTPMTQPLCDTDVVFGGKILGDGILMSLVNKVSESSTMFRSELLPAGGSFYSIDGGDRALYITVITCLRLLALGKVAYIAEPLGQCRVHGVQNSEAVMRDPATLTDWYGIIQRAKELGYLVDPTAERNCLCALGRLIYSSLPGTHGADERSLRGLFEVLNSLIADVATLTVAGDGEILADSGNS